MYRVLPLLFAIVTLATPVFGAGRAIGIGDTLDITVFGVAELHKKSQVEEDGNISYFMLGELKVAGMTVDQVQAEIDSKLVRTGLIKDPKVAVEIVARQPFYVTGDVLKPGAQPYIANITVRSGVALAGGLDPLGIRGAVKPKDPVELRGELNAVAVDLVRHTEHLRALAAEMAGQSTFPMDNTISTPLSSDVVVRVHNLELQQLRQRISDTASQKFYLKQVIEQSQAQIAALVNRRKTEEEALRQQNDNIARIQSFVGRGIAVQERVNEAQRAMVLLKSGLYESMSAGAQANRVLLEAEYKLKTLDDVRATAIAKEMLDATTAQAVASGRAAALREQLSTKQSRDTAASFTIYRRTNGKPQRIDADSDTDLLPGDILEVSFSKGISSSSNTKKIASK